MEELNESFVKSATTVQTLFYADYYSLRYIFQHLTLKELIDVENVCDEFKAMSEDMYKTYKTLRIDDMAFTNNTIVYEKLRRVGPYITTLKVVRKREQRELWLSLDEYKSREATKLLTFIKTFCTKMSAIHFDGIFFQNFDVGETMLLNVDIVHLNNCLGISRAHLETMFNLKHVKILSLTELIDFEIDGGFLTQLQEIEELNLTASYKLMVDPHVFVEFCRTNPHLRILKVSKCPWINDICLWGISTYLMNLEYLEICCVWEHYKNAYELLTNLPNLKDLTLWQGNLDICDLIQRLAHHDRLEVLNIHFSWYSHQNPDIWMHIRDFTMLKKLTISHAEDSPVNTLARIKSAGTLEELDISSTPITDEDLLKIITMFRNIKCINVNCCTNITENVIKKILQLLQVRRRCKKLILKWRINYPLKSDLLIIS